MYFYALSAGALVLWAIATLSPVQEVAKLTGENLETKQAAVLAVAAFIIPALDTILTKIDLKVR